MNKTSRWMGAIMCGVILVGATSVMAQDWPQWRGPNRDAKATFTAPAEWPKELTATWKVQVGSGDSTPALVGDKLFVFSRQGEDEVTQCLSAADGKVLWTDKNPAQAVTGAASRHPGPAVRRPWPTARSLRWAWAASSRASMRPRAQVVWRKDPFPKMVPQFFAANSPIIVDKMAIAHVGGGSGAIIAFDLATGEEKWKCENQAVGYSSPVCATIEGTKMIVELTDKNVVGVGAADGKVLWEVRALRRRRWRHGQGRWRMGKGGGAAWARVRVAAV